MIKEFVLSFGENIRQKTTNPFFGTLILVWIVHNWKLVYTFFNFEKSAGLASRIAFLGTYLEPKPFAVDLGICLVETFCVLICSYVLLNLSRLIINFFEKIVTPWVYKVTDKSSIVLKSDYLALIENRNDLSRKLDAEIEGRRILQSKLEELENKFSKVDSPAIVSTDDDDKKMADELMQRIIEKDYTRQFEKIIELCNNKSLIDISNIQFDKIEEALSYFMKVDLVEVVKVGSFNTNQYSLSPLGKEVKKSLVLNEIL